MLTGANTYSGATYINGGTLQLGDGTTDGSIANTTSIVDGGALISNLVGSQTIGVVISSGGSLTKLGNGTLSLTAANTYTGCHDRERGTIQASSTANSTGVFGTARASRSTTGPRLPSPPPTDTSAPVTGSFQQRSTQEVV